MRTTIRITGLLLALLWALPALAAPAEGATRFIKTRQTAVRAALDNQQGDAAGDALEKEIDRMLDYEALSRHALRDHWDAHSPTERKQFVDLLRQLVERSYKQNLRSTLGYKIDYLGEEKGELGTVVKTRARSTKNRREPPVSIDYTLHQVDGGWQVLDITTDGVSMVRNYRSQFNRILKKDGWDELIRRMTERLEDPTGV